MLAERAWKIPGRQFYARSMACFFVFLCTQAARQAQWDGLRPRRINTLHELGMLQATAAQITSKSNLVNR